MAYLPSDIADELQLLSPALLREVATYAEALTACREHDIQRKDSDDTDRDDRPEDVPAKASITIKTINGNRYHCWQ